MDGLLPGITPTERELVERMSMDERIARAIALLREHEPEEGYYLAFSAGKDSQVIEHLAKLAGVKYEAVYRNTTIDPPELIAFLRKHYPHVRWEQPKMAMMRMVATAPKVPPTRMVRWCCDEYKELGGNGRVKVFGVRAAESSNRANWREIATDRNKNKAVCPIVHWTDAQVWEFLNAHNLPHCSLYDEPGITRIGCVGCPLAGVEGQDKEFKRWPRYEANWKRAIIANWEKWHNVPTRKGEPRYHAKFKNGEEFWIWWRTKRAPDIFREECQTGLMWTNQSDNETFSTTE